MLFHHTEIQKAISFLQEPLKTGVNSKYQSKGPIYILHLLAFVEIRLLSAFFWEKTELGIVTKNCAECGIRVKKERECGIRSPLPDPHSLRRQLEVHFLTGSRNQTMRFRVYIPLYFPFYCYRFSSLRSNYFVCNFAIMRMVLFHSGFTHCLMGIFIPNGSMTVVVTLHPSPLAQPQLCLS